MFSARKREVVPIVRDGAEHPSARVSAVDWRDMRRPGAPGDDELHERTVRWLATLPPRLRPLNTGRHFPRIVNRICALWSQCEYTRLHFQSLLLDRRKGRSGFPPEVRVELEALQQYYFEHFSGLPAILWNAVPVHPPRIPDIVFAPLPDSGDIDIEPL